MKTHFLKFAFAATVSLASQNLFAAENKIALVIGNSIYADKSLNLKNPVNDAKDMKTALEKVGFTVLYQPNATADQIDELRNEFVDQLGRNKDSIGLFYYSGHGMQMDGVNYLIPSDAKISLKVDLAKRGYDVDLILGAMEEAHNKANIVILDACRDNPLSKSVKSLKGSKGLTADSPPQGTLVAYATKSGSTANDNPNEKNSLYTKYLKQYLFEPGAKILDALTKVRNAVMKEEPQQIPSEVNLLSDLNLCLAGCAANSTPNVENSPPLLSFVSGANTVNQNKSYSVKFKATDSDGDLSKIFIDWGDDSTPTSKTAKNGSTLTFTHTYKFAGIYDLIATAIDKQNNESETFDKSVEVKEIAATKPIENPVVSVKIPNVSNINVSPSAVIYGNSLTFTAKLNTDLPAGHSVKIDYGNGLEKMNGSGRNFSFKVTPSDLGSSLYSVGIYDSKDVLKSNQLTGNFSVSEAPPVVIVQPEPEPVVTTKGDVETFVSGSKTFSYTKIANDGSELPKTAKLGTGAKDWACTKDNNTGLIWEVKTDDGGLRDKDKTYTNYTVDYPKCDDELWGGGGKCKEYGFTGKFGDSTNTDGFVKAVNKQGLCGAKDWRLPESEELRGLVVCSDGKYADLGKDEYGYICSSNGAPNYNLVTQSPTINTTYFPNTDALSWFWSSSPDANYSDGAWYVNFNNGYAYGNSKDGNDFVRLVRG